MNSPTEYLKEDTPIFEYLSNPETGLKERIEDEKAELDGFEEKKRGLKISRKYKLCTVEKSKEAYCKYLDIDNAVSAAAVKESELIKLETTTLEAKKALIDTQITALSGLFKDVKTKVKEIHEAACALTSCISDEKSCNKNLYDEIKSQIRIDLNDGNGERDIDQIAAVINEKAKNLLEKKTADAIGTSVDVAGIQTFAQINKVLEFGSELYNKTKLFREDVLANITNTHTKLTDTRVELVSIIQEIAQEKVNYHKSNACVKSLEDTNKYVDKVIENDANCGESEDRKKQIDEICKYIFKNMKEKDKDDWDNEDPKERNKGDKNSPKEQRPNRKPNEDQEEDDFWNPEN